MIALYGAVLAASLLGSLHCAGMCGGFVAFYAGADQSAGLSRIASHTAYNGGRLVAYGLLGAAAGALGAALDLAGAAAGLQRGGALVAGGLMILWGLMMLLQIRGLQIGARLPSGIQRLLGRLLGGIGGKPPVIRALTLGLLSALLPCGWLYAFAITAAGTGHPALGSLVMAAFWLGTVPVMLGLGFGVQFLAGPLRRHLPLVSALVLIAIGAYTVIDRAAIPVERFARLKSAVALDRGTETQNPWELPCCKEEQEEESGASEHGAKP